MQFTEIYSGILAYGRAITTGYYRLFLRLRNVLLAIVQTWSPYHILFFGSVLILCVSSLAAWIEYSVNFQESTQSVGSNLKPVFFLPGFLGILFYLIGFRFRSTIFIVVVILVALLYGIGIIYPNPVHTSMLERSEYSFQPVWLVLYGLALIGAGIGARFALADALINPDWIKDFLFSSRPTPDIQKPE